MNSKQLAIYDFILSTSQKYQNILTEQINDLINEFINDSSLSVDELKKIIISKLEKQECIITDKTNNLYSKYMIISPQSLMEFLIKNFDYGYILNIDNSTYRIPLDDDNKLLNSNKIVTYNDSRVLSLLKKTYKALPDFLKDDDISLGTQLKLTSKYLFYKNWKLKKNKDMFPQTIGCLPDLIELEAGFFEEHGIKYQRYIFTSKNNPTKMHSFIAYEYEENWYYFEYILKAFRGIHKFSSQEELEKIVFSKLLQLDILNPKEEFLSFDDYTQDQEKLYELAIDYKNKAMYNFKVGINYSESDEDKLISAKLIEDGYSDWKKYINFISKLPKTFDFYSLKRIKKPKDGINYYDFYDWIGYQNSILSTSQVIKEGIEQFKLQNTIYKLVIDGLLFPGIITLFGEYAEFKPILIPSNIKIMDTDNKIIEITKLLNKNIFSLAYGSYSVGRSVFTLNYNGKFNQYKGVDPMLTPDELTFSRINRFRNLIGNETTPYTLQLIDKDNKTFLRFRGSCSLEELQHEKKLSRELQALGFYSPKIDNVSLLPHEAIEKYKLPRLDEFFEDYLERTNHSNYLSAKESIEFSRTNNKGFRIGQEIKTLDNIFRITDLEYAVLNKDINKIKSLLNFSQSLNKEDNPNLQTYVINFSKILGKQLAILFNNNYYNFEGNRHQDITLNGEICDNKFVNYKLVMDRLNNSISKTESIINKTPEKLAKKERLENQRNTEKIKYYFQFFALISSIKIMLDAYSLGYKKHIERPAINVFMGSILSNLTDEKREELKDYYLSIENFTDQINMIMTIDNHYSDINDEMRHFYHLIFNTMFDAIKNPVKTIAVAKTILEEQEFINIAIKMTKEDRLVLYLKRLIKEKQLDINSPKFLENIYDGNRMGILIKKEKLYTETIDELSHMFFDSLDDFYKMAKYLVQEKYLKDPLLLHEIFLEKQKYKNQQLKIDTIKFNENGNPISYNKEPIKVVANSGISSPVFIFLLLSGSSCVMLGIILSLIK